METKEDEESYVFFQQKQVPICTQLIRFKKNDLESPQKKQVESKFYNTNSFLLNWPYRPISKLIINDL